MRTAKDNDGERLFGYGDFLTSQQISSYFSRLAAKRNVQLDQLDSEDEAPEEDLQHVLGDRVLSEVSIQHSHPIIYDSYNICELVLNSKLNSFSVSMYGVSVKPSNSTYQKLQSNKKTVRGIAFKPGAGL